jgi:hypothetical protein
VRRQGLEPRTRGLRVCWFIRLFCSDLVSNDADARQELPFCPFAGIRCPLRIPDATGAYRGIRANMEQTSTYIGLDHCGEGVWAVPGTGHSCQWQRCRPVARRPARAAAGARRKRPSRSVITAGSTRIEAPDHAFGISDLLGGDGAGLRRTPDAPNAPDRPFTAESRAGDVPFA